MKQKVISSIIIFSMLVQIPLSHIGCTTFYPAAEKDPRKYSNGDKLLLKMKDKTILETTAGTSLFIDSPSNFIYGFGKEYDYTTQKFSDFRGTVSKEMIDSTKFFQSNSINYYIYWLKDNRKITLEKASFSITPDSGSNFWLLYDNNRSEFRKVYGSDIEAIEIEKTNWLATSFLIVLGAVALTLLIFSLTWEGISFDDGGSL